MSVKRLCIRSIGEIVRADGGDAADLFGQSVGADGGRDEDEGVHACLFVGGEAVCDAVGRAAQRGEVDEFRRDRGGGPLLAAGEGEVLDAAGLVPEAVASDEIDVDVLLP